MNATVKGVEVDVGRRAVALHEAHHAVAPEGNEAAHKGQNAHGKVGVKADGEELEVEHAVEVHNARFGGIGPGTAGNADRLGGREEGGDEEGGRG